MVHLDVIPTKGAIFGLEIEAAHDTEQPASVLPFEFSDCSSTQETRPRPMLALLGREDSLLDDDVRVVAVVFALECAPRSSLRTESRVKGLDIPKEGKACSRYLVLPAGQRTRHAAASFEGLVGPKVANFLAEAGVAPGAGCY